MALKKKTTLRDKAARGRSAPAAAALGLSQAATPVPFLNQLRQSKRDKLAAKSSGFKSKVMGAQGVSKSTLRRQKRRAREDLAGSKMDELLSALPDDGEGDVAGETTRVLKPEYIAAARKNAPSVMNKRGKAKVLQQETQHYRLVLASSSFRKDPFAAVKAALASQK